jgi:hypothetical protein
MRLLLAAFVLYLAFLVATLAYALWKGGKDERTGAVTILLAALSSQVASETGLGRGGYQIGVMVIDVAVFIAFVALAYRSKKFWPIWAAASQLVALLTHWAVVLDPSVVRTIYATAQPFWAFPVIAALALGTRAHQRSLG